VVFRAVTGTVTIARAALAQIISVTTADPINEVCGLLFGSPTEIRRVAPACNVAPDPRTAFEIDPSALIAAFRNERSGGERLIGHYHSHPSGSAEPSARDLAAAEPGKLWLITAAARARLWLAEQGSFREMQLIVN
jgi:desampylase